MRARTTAPLMAILLSIMPCGVACADDAPAERKDTHAPPENATREVAFRYTADQVAAWPEGKVDGHAVRICPTIQAPEGWEMNHHLVTAVYEGDGSVAVSVAHHEEDRLDKALKEKGRRSSFRALKSGQPRRIVSGFKRERFAWLILRVQGDVRVKEIVHKSWRGRHAILGHLPGFFEFENGRLPYRLMYPRDYDPKKSYPLVLSVHGSGGVGVDNARSMERIILARSLFLKYFFEKDFECFSLVPQIPADKVIPEPYWPQGPRGKPTPLYHPDWPAVNGVSYVL